MIAAIILGVFAILAVLGFAAVCLAGVAMGIHDDIHGDGT